MHMILNPLKENIKEQLKPLATKKDLSAQELDNIKDALCILSMVEDALDREADYSRMRDIYGEGNSYRRGRDAQTGQYVSRADQPHMPPMRTYAYGMNGGYSNHGTKQDVLNSMEQAMQNATTENERMMYAGMIDNLRMSH